MKKENIIITKLISELEFQVNKLKFLYEKYPDLKITRGIFSSKGVNSDYDDILFYQDKDSLSMGTLKYIDFEFNGICEKIEIYSIPKQNKILNKTRNYNTSLTKYKTKLCFTKFFSTFKFKKFDENILSKTRKHLLEFINHNKDLEINYSNIDKKLEKILNFR